MKKQIYIDDQIFPLGTDLSVINEKDNQPQCSKFVGVPSDHFCVPTDFLLKNKIDLKKEFNYETDFVAISTGGSTEDTDTYLIIPTDLSLVEKKDVKRLTKEILIGSSKFGREETTVETLHINGMWCSESIGLNYISEKANNELNLKTHDDRFGCKNTIVATVMVESKSIEELELTEQLLSSMKNGDLETILRIFKIKEDEVDPYNEEEWDEHFSHHIQKPDGETNNIDDLITEYKKDPDKFKENINKYIYSDWIDRFPRISTEFRNFVDKYFQEDLPLTKPQVYRSYSPSMEFRTDVNYLLTLDKLEPELRDLITEKIDKELEEIKITLETSRKHLEGCKKKEKKIPYTEVKITHMGTNDMIKLANKATDLMEFVNFNDLKSISSDELNKSDEFEYFIDQSNRVIIRLDDVFYKYDILPDYFSTINTFPNFQSILDQLEKEKCKVDKKLQQIEQELLLKRIKTDTEVAMDNFCNCIPTDERAIKLCQEIYKINCGMSYLKRIPEANKEQYSKLCWIMYSNFYNGKNTYGYLDQKLLE